MRTMRREPEEEQEQSGSQRWWRWGSQSESGTRFRDRLSRQDNVGTGLSLLCGSIHDFSILLLAILYGPLWSPPPARLQPSRAHRLPAVHGVGRFHAHALGPRAKEESMLSRQGLMAMSARRFYGALGAARFATRPIRLASNVDKRLRNRSEW